MGICASKNPETIYKDVTYKDTRLFVPDIKCGKVIKVYDGDTFTIATRLKETPKNNIYRFSVRIRHIDCPEIRTTNKEEKEIAEIAKQTVHDLIYGKVVYLHNIIYDKYGRLCCDVLYGNINVGSHLLQNGLAVPYEGKTKISSFKWKYHYTMKQKERNS